MKEEMAERALNGSALSVADGGEDDVQGLLIETQNIGVEPELDTV